MNLEYNANNLNQDMLCFVKDNYLADIKDATNQMAKSERSTALRQLRKNIIKVKTQWADDETQLKNVIESVKKEQVRSQILNDSIRGFVFQKLFRKKI